MGAARPSLLLLLQERRLFQKNRLLGNALFITFIGRLPTMWRGAVRLFDSNPIIMLSWVMGGVAITLPFVVPPIRRTLGLRTNQYTKEAPRGSI